MKEIVETQGFAEDPFEELVDVGQASDQMTAVQTFVTGLRFHASVLISSRITLRRIASRGSFLVSMNSRRAWFIKVW